MENWRRFFEGSGVDLWTICERALALAYKDSAEDFPAKRDRLAQKLFAPEKFDFHVCELDASQLSGSKPGVGSVEERMITPLGAYDEAEALTEELEEEILSKRDVLDIKETLKDSYQSETETFNSLRRLELMHLSFDVLKETEIGKVVNSLRKHSSKRVAILAKRLVRGWKELVEACCRSAVDVAAAATADTVASGSLVVNEEMEHGLPSPPMDEAALLVAPTASVEMLQLWDLMDDVTSAGSDHHEAVDHETRYSRTSRAKKTSGSHAFTKDSERGTVMSRASPTNKKDNLDLAPRRIGITEEPSNLKECSTLLSVHRFDEEDGLKKMVEESAERRSSSNNSIERRTEAVAPQKAQISKPHISSSFSDEKLQATKRNLRENYEREEHAKKQRTIQVLDLNDLPKGGPSRVKNPHLMHGRPPSQIRPRAMSCR